MTLCETRNLHSLVIHKMKRRLLGTRSFGYLSFHFQARRSMANAVDNNFSKYTPPTMF